MLFFGVELGRFKIAKTHNLVIEQRVVLAELS